MSAAAKAAAYLVLYAATGFVLAVLFAAVAR